MADPITAFLADLARTPRVEAVIDGITVQGDSDRGRVRHAHPPLPIGSHWVIATDAHGYEWRVLEVIAAGQSRPVCVTIANVEPAEGLRRAIRIATALNGGGRAA